MKARYDGTCENCGGAIFGGETEIRREPLPGQGLRWVHADEADCLPPDLEAAAEARYFDLLERRSEIMGWDDGPPEPGDPAEDAARYGYG